MMTNITLALNVVKIVKKACKGDTYLERLVLYENAASILKSGLSG